MIICPEGPAITLVTLRPLECENHDEPVPPSTSTRMIRDLILLRMKMRPQLTWKLDQNKICVADGVIRRIKIRSS